MKAFLIQSLMTLVLRTAMVALVLARALATLACFGVIFTAMVHYLSGTLDQLEIAGLGTAVVILLIARWAFDQARLAILRRFFEPAIGEWRIEDIERAKERARDHFDPRIPYSGCDGPTQFNISTGGR